MKKMKLFLVLCLLVFKVSGQYINPLVQCPSSSVAHDGSIEIQVVGAKSPCSYIEWYNAPGWQNSGGLHAKNIGLSDSPMRVTVFDSLCRMYETVFSIYDNPAKQIIIDTIITSMPTPGHSDGSINVQFGFLPTGFTKHFGLRSGTLSTVTSTNFTGLASGLYQFSVDDPNSNIVTFDITIPLMPGNFPCTHFDVSMEEDLPSRFESGTGCDASLLVDLSGPSVGDYLTLFTYYFSDGGSSVLNSFDPYLLDFEDEVCRTAHRLYVGNEGSKFQFHHYYFLPDSADTYTVWNAPDSVLPNTDTLRLQSIYNCSINPADSVGYDTMYVNDYVPLGKDQFEITFAIIQAGDTFYVYDAPVLDSGVNYFFDITVHCGVSSDQPFNDHQQNFIYFPALNTRSDFFRAPPSSTLSVINKVKVYPNPFNEQVNIYSGKKVRKVEVYTINGKLVHTAQVNNNFYTIETSGLPPSMYLLKVYSEDGSSHVSKITKM